MAPASTLGSKSSRGFVARSVLASLAGLAALVCVTSDASAFSVKKTTKGDLVHWETDNVQFTLDPSVEANVTSGADATKEAMGSWSGTVGAPDLVGNAPTADSPTQPTFDRKNGVFFAPGGYDPAGKALAITVLTYDNATGKILDADVIFNGMYSFAVLPADAHGDDSDATDTESVADEGSVDPGTIYDLHHVVAHELGHSLGMNDEMQNKSALMYKYTSPDDATLRGPASDDVTGLAELYEDNKSSSASGNGCGSATVAPKNPSKSASNAAMFATFGLLLFLVLRARSDRRARLAFVLASAAACVAFMPNLSGKKGVAAAATTPFTASLGHARATVHASSVAMENGLFKTTYELTTTTCRVDSCPKTGRGVTFGGTVGNITQEVGGRFAPNLGDEVDVSFKNLPNRFAPLANPLAGRVNSDKLADVKLVTRAATVAN